VRGLLCLAGATARAILTQRLILALVAGVAFLIPVSAWLTLFAMGAKSVLLREMGLASLLLGGLLVVLFADQYQPGEDLRHGMGLAILVTPLAPWQYVLGRLVGLGLALSLITAGWAAVLAWTLSAHQAVGLDGGMLLGAALGIAQLLVIAAVLQRVSLWLPTAPTMTVGLGLYLAGHLAGWLGALAGDVGIWLSRLLPNLAGMNLITPAALGEMPLEGLAGLAGLAAVHAALYAALFVYWTGSSLALEGAVVR